MDLSKDQIEQLVSEVCPRCLAGEPVTLRQQTGEWTHASYAAGGFSSSLCLATNLRNKYQSVLNG